MLFGQSNRMFVFLCLCALCAWVLSEFVFLNVNELDRMSDWFAVVVVDVEIAAI